MYEKVLRAYKGGAPRLKLVRVKGAIPPSQQPAHRRNYYHDIRAKCFEALGGVCKQCSFADVRALQIDHVGSDGQEDRKGFSGGSYYAKVLKEIGSGRYQLLCANCNWIKRHEANEVPQPGRSRKG